MLPADTTTDIDATGSEQVAAFGGLEIRWDSRVLRPRHWTTAQSHWVAALADGGAPGPILELCCGAGQIGLLAATLTGRDLVQVDRDPVASDYARRNARLAGVAADVRTGSLTDAVAPGEMFGLAILDPPWVPTAQVPNFPEDPVGAIDGGLDGSDQLLLGLGVALRHLAPGGYLVVQVGSHEQVNIVERLVDGIRGGDSGWRVLEVRDYLPGGLLVAIGDRD